MSILDTKTKAKSSLLTVGVAVANTIGATFGLPPLTVPEGASTEQAIATVVVWLLNVIIIYTPTIIAAVANSTYIKSKTEQNIAGINTGTTAPHTNQVSETIPKIKCPKCGKMVDDGTWCSECSAVLHPTIPPKPKYQAPTDLATVGADLPSSFLKWNAFDGLLDTDLTLFDPQIRIEYAWDILNEDKLRLDRAWVEQLKETKANISVLRMPASTDFIDIRATDEYEKLVKDSTPGCDYLTSNQKRLLWGYGKYYLGAEWLTKLGDKNINWQLAHTINEMAKYKYEAVAAS